MFDRFCSVKVGNNDFTGLRTRFEVSSGYQNRVKRATISLYNISESKFNSLKPDDIVEFSILENQSLKIVFYGYLSSTDRNKDQDGSEITTLYSWSGNNVYLKKKYAVTFDKGATGTDVLDWLRKQLSPIEVILNEDSNTAINSKVYKGGLTIKGTLSDALYQFSSTINQQAILDDAQVFIGSPGTKTIPVSSDSEKGMIGHPSITIAGAKVSTELNAIARIGDNVSLTSRYYSLMSSDSDSVTLNNRTANGLYRINDITLLGDTHGEQWQNDYELLLLEDRA